MLVLTREEIKDSGVRECHPVERFLERVDTKDRDPAVLYKVIAEINLYLPEDWRLTKKSNEFSILVVPASGQPYKLVGFSYHTENETTLHMISTVLCKHFRDKFVREKYNDAPNLYYFQSRPEDSMSPLFARQYEKVKFDENEEKTGTQYHRVHPLNKWGLDLDHFKWIKWDTNGNAAWVNYPDPDYHGMDYWKVPLFRGNRTAYVRRFEEGMKEFCVIPPELPAQNQTPYEKEFKLLVPPSEQHPNTVYKTLREHIGLHRQFNVECENKETEQVDIYLDDDQFTLLKSGVSFRFRKTPKSARVTLKYRLNSNATKAIEIGEYQRIEEEMTITRVQQKRLLNEKERISALPYRLIAYIAPDCDTIKPVAAVRTKRKLMQIENQVLQKAEICFDIVEYLSFDNNRLEPDVDAVEYVAEKGKVIESDVEIEIESKGMPRDDAELLALYLKDDLQLISSSESKYERAIRFLKMSEG